MKVGDIIRLDYDMWVVDPDKLFDTTHEKLAKEHEIFDEKKSYKPLPTIVGANKVIKGLEESLLKAEVGKDYEVDISPAEGFGERNPELTETFSMREVIRLPEFRKGDVYPEVGTRIGIKKKTGTITRIADGRVRVDFNHPLAGKTIRYKYNVKSQCKKGKEQIGAVIEMHYGKIEGFEVDVKKGVSTIKVPDTCKYDLSWFQMKYRIVKDLQDHTDVHTVRFVEEYLKKIEEKVKETKDEDKGGEVKEGEDKSANKQNE